MADAHKDHFHLTVGREIRKRREAEGFTTLDLARLVGVNHNVINHAEQGVNVSLFVLARMAEEFDCTLDDLVPVEATTLPGNLSAAAE